MSCDYYAIIIINDLGFFRSFYHNKECIVVQRWEETLKDGPYNFPNRTSHVQFSMWNDGTNTEGTDKNRIYSMEIEWLNIAFLYTDNRTK